MGSNNNYVLFDYNKFVNDIKRVDFERNGKVNLTKILEGKLGISQSTLSNSLRNAERGTGGFDLSLYDDSVKYGTMQRVYMLAICNEMGLSIDDYIAVKKPAQNSNNLNDIDMDFKNIVVAGLKSVNEYNKTIVSLIPDITELISKNNDGIARLIASLVKVEYQNRDILASISSDIKAQGEKLDKIASGIQTMNDKYNKPSAYIRK